MRLNRDDCNAYPSQMCAGEKESEQNSWMLSTAQHSDSCHNIEVSCMQSVLVFLSRCGNGRKAYSPIRQWILCCEQTRRTAYFVEKSMRGHICTSHSRTITIDDSDDPSIQRDQNCSSSRACVFVIFRLEFANETNEEPILDWNLDKPKWTKAKVNERFVLHFSHSRLSWMNYYESNVERQCHISANSTMTRFKHLNIFARQMASINHSMVL